MAEYREILAAIRHGASLMRVFVSSTCFDLVDARAEIGAMLTELGIDPVLSDDALSEFSVLPDRNSIETCLVNVQASDAVVLVLDRRYGPRLGQRGFDDVSATHLEYRRAKEARIPIHLFVRDRLDADIASWRKAQKSSDFVPTWASDRNSLEGLSELLDEHRALHSTSTTSNWYTPFRNSVELKAVIRKRLRALVLPECVVQAISRNEFPIFTSSTELEEPSSGGNDYLFKVRIVNRGGAPAFNVEWRGPKANTVNRSELVLPGEGHAIAAVLLPRPLSRFSEEVELQYSSAIGVRVKERIQIAVRPTTGLAVLSGANLVERTYHLSSSPTISFAKGDEGE